MRKKKSPQINKIRSSMNNQQEIAAPLLAGPRNLWGETVAAGLTPARLARLLSAADQGHGRDYLTLAEEMEERDPHYRSEIAKRKLAVSSLPLVVESASDDPRDVELADEVRELTRQPGFRGLLKDLLDAIAKGYSVCEIIWQHGQRWQPLRYEWRDPRFFVFDRVSGRELLLVPANDGDVLGPQALPPYKFICHLPHLKTGMPLRGGIARVVAWAWICKSYTLKDWLAFAEVFGLPLRVGKYRPGAGKRDVEVLKAAVAGLGSDAAAVIPDSMQIEFIEAAGRGGGHELFRQLADWLDTQISRAILGQSATTSGTAGKLGNEQAQAQVRVDIRDDDAHQLAETLNRDLVRPFIDLNWGPQPHYPELCLRAPAREDLSILVTALKELAPLGLRVERSVVLDRLGLPDPAPEAICLGDVLK